jgi:SAM-dependent methyltransferase
LELGGGTGVTTKYIVDLPMRQGISFTYTLTDLSGSLATAAEKKFAGQAFLEFMIIDIEKQPPEKFMHKFHTIISINCIHATRDLQASTKNIRQMLRSDGLVLLSTIYFGLILSLVC